MKLNEIKAPKRKLARRVGRGISAGQGKNAGRGTKGQKSRSRYKLPRRFEGGQMPLIQRSPKVGGFKNLRPRPLTVTVERLMKVITPGEKVTIKLLVQKGLIKPRNGARNVRAKIVGKLASGKFNYKLGAKVTAATLLKVGHKDE